MAFLSFIKKEYNFLLLAILSFGCEQGLPTEILSTYQTLPDEISYNYNVKSILSDNCFACHGPDSNKRKANLRLDLSEEEAFTQNSDVLTLNDKKKSLIRRLFTDNIDERMPPPESHLSLSKHEIATLVKWINQGAKYEPHWSFVPIKTNNETPKIGKKWGQNSIDFFIKNKLDENHILPSKKADKEILIRRLSFTLKGLPPKIEEIDAFLNDTSTDAYEKLIDLFLDSPNYGERMAAEWMNVSRYADSDGYLDDKHRDFSPWRDWVIDAFNNNMSYDQFVTYQLAGDLIPESNTQSIKATAFNRLHKKNSEAGIIFEEYRAEYVSDRTTTFGKAFLGLTLECAKCHDHKYDPITQKNFYEISSFFNNTNEIGTAVYGPGQTAGPSLLLADKDQQMVIDYIKNELNNQSEKIVTYQKNNKEEFEVWLSNEQNTFESLKKNKDRGLVAFYPFDKFRKKSDKKFLSPSGLSYNIEAKINEPEIKNGYKNKGLFINEFTNLTLPKKVGWFDQTDPFSISLALYPENHYDKAIIFSHCEQIRLGLKGYSLFIKNNKLNFIIARSWPQNAIEIETIDPIPEKKWTEVTITYDGKGHVNGLNFFINGEKAPTIKKGNELYKSILFKPNIHTYGFNGFRVGPMHKFKTFLNGGIDELKIYNIALSALEIAYKYDVTPFESTNLNSLNESRKILLKEYFSKNIDDSSIKMNNEYRRLRGKLMNHIDSIPELMVMGDTPEPRQTYLLKRGVYNEFGEEVFPNTPKAILNFDNNLPKNRLGLSKWLFDNKNPLTARVFVNRIWQMHFGQGLVSSSDNFGSQGNTPSHPELLDWLSTSFISYGWNIKRLHKLILMSSCYMQESTAGKVLQKNDPDNKLLARGPRFRMSAEMIRDNAIAISGLLVNKIGGKSVYPYQPDGIWDLSDKSWRYKYPKKKDENLYRRSLYTFWKRSAPPPLMTLFDAPNRDFCATKRTLTSSPLQSLALLNNPEFIEAGRALAEKTLAKNNNSENELLAEIFRKVTSRCPSENELNTLKKYYNEEYKRFRKNYFNAIKYISIGEKKLNDGIDPVKTAALATVINGLMNTSEAVNIY